MNINFLRHRKTDWLWLILSLLTLLVYFYYSLFYIFYTPYPGIAFATSPNGWIITDSRYDNLNFNDVVLAIGDLEFQQYLSDRNSVPFAHYTPGDSVPILLGNSNRIEYITLPTPTLIDRFLRFINISGWFFPFWLVGTAIIVFLRPRDNRWALLVLTMYSITLWVTSGPLANWQIGYSKIIYTISSYGLTAAIVHLHLIAPTPLSQEWRKPLLRILHATVLILVVLDLLQLVPRSMPTNSVALGMLFSVGLLTARLFKRKDAQAERTAARLMLAGMGFGFGPGILVQVLNSTVNTNLGNSLGYTIALLAVPLLPGFYLYAIFKRQLGGLEFRANRFLSVYSFLLIYPPIFLLLILVGENFIEPGSGRTAYLLLISGIFVILLPSLLSRFQKWVNRLAYGTIYNPEELIRLFASRIPTTRRRPDFIHLLLQEILPSLLIRESALVITTGPRPSLIYTQGWSETAVSQAIHTTQFLQRAAGVYRPPVLTTFLPWLRLIIPLFTGNRVIGYWLFGNRDPDNFYPLPDIDLLHTLGNQLAPVIENIELYENLEEQVATRTTELKAERDRTRAILESAGEGIFFTDSVGRIMYTNPAMANLTGYELTEENNQPLPNWIHGDENSARAIAEAIATQSGWSGETIWKLPANHTLDIHLTLAPLQQLAQGINGFVGVLSDISRLKEVDRLKTNIIGNVSHELKTPLTNIALYLSLLENGAAENHPRYIGVIRQETSRLNHLIQDLLDLSKLESGELVTERKPISITKLVNRVATTLKPRFDEKGLVLQVRLNDDLPLISADMGLIDQVVTNLLTNALNYAATPGTVTITAGEGNLMANAAVWLSIADTGPGIPHEEQDLIFERFYRGKRPKKEAIPGTGLGLAITKEIIDRHNGRIEVHSQPGTGTTFTFWIQTADTHPPSHT